MRKLCLLIMLVSVPSVVHAQILGSGTADALNESVCTSSMQNAVAFTFQISGTYSGTITFQARTLNTLGLVSLDVANVATGSSSTTTTSTGVFAYPNVGFSQVCATMTSYSNGGANIVITRGWGSGGAGGGGGGVSADVNIIEIDGNAISGPNLPVDCVSGCSGSGTEATDDGSVPAGTDNANANALSMVYTGSAWARLTFGQAAAGSSLPVVLPTTQFPNAAAIADSTPDPTVTKVAAYLMAYDDVGGDWNKVRSSLDPCSGGAKTVIPINISTATTTELTSALAGASNYYYVCSINLGPAAGAQNFALVDDDSDNCASVTSGMAGGTTAGTGWNFAANGGLMLGNGQGTIAKTNGTNRVICAVTSANVQISGVMTVVAAP